MCRWSCSHTRWKAVLGHCCKWPKSSPSQFRPCVLLMFHVVIPPLQHEQCWNLVGRNFASQIGVFCQDSLSQNRLGSGAEAHGEDISDAPFFLFLFCCDQYRVSNIGLISSMEAQSSRHPHPSPLLIFKAWISAVIAVFHLHACVMPVPFVEMVPSSS